MWGTGDTDSHFLPWQVWPIVKQQPEACSAWESAGVNNAPYLGPLKSSLELVILEIFGMAFSQVVASLFFFPAVQNVNETD